MKVGRELVRRQFGDGISNAKLRFIILPLYISEITDQTLGFQNIFEIFIPKNAFCRKIRKTLSYSNE